MHCGPKEEHMGFPFCSFWAVISRNVISQALALLGFRLGILKEARLDGSFLVHENLNLLCTWNDVDISCPLTILEGWKEADYILSSHTGPMKMT